MTDQELQNKYPSYSKSIFSDFKPDDPEILEWKENVLQKVKGDNILPHYIEKDKDFDIFWDWIIHFFAVIVYFGRNFKKIFTDLSDYLNLIGEFMKERDYISDSRVQIDKDLTIPFAGEIYHKIFCNYKLLNNGNTIINNGYNTTDYLPINDGSVITLKVLGYNKSLGEYNGSIVNDINIVIYYADKTLGSIINSFNITEFQAKWGYRIVLPSSSDINNKFCYIRISYPNIGESSLPLYLGVFLEGEESSFETNRSEESIFSVHSDFRKRGTFKGASLVKKILESKKEDNFYSDYLPQKNTGWFLNKNSPIFGRLSTNIKIDSFVANGISISSGVSTTVTIKEQYFMLNQNTSLIAKWKGNKADSVIFNISIYDKNKNLLSDTPILGDWVFDSVNHILTPSLINSVSIYPKYNSIENINSAELAIELIDNPKSAVFSTDTFDKDRFLNSLNKIYLFSKYNNSGNREAYYLRITSIILNGLNTSHITDSLYNINFETGLYLRKLPITLGFLNNKQYYICCFKNNGSYSNEKAAEIISQKVIPYNGYRIFVDNSLYKNRVNITLALKQIYFNRIDKKIYLSIKGGVPPYIYRDDDALVDTYSYSQFYEEEVVYGTHTIKITDALESSILAKVSCQSYNDVDYKFKLYISKNNSIEIFIKLFGGTETSYTISNKASHLLLYDSGYNQLEDINNNELATTEIINADGLKIVPANIWVDVTDIIGNNFSFITSDTKLYIKDNGVSSIIESELSLQDLFKDFALDFYDNGKGELVN